MKRFGIIKISIGVFSIAVTGLGFVLLSGTTNSNATIETKTVEIARPVKAMQLKEPASVFVRKFPGTVKAKRESKIAFRIDGPIVEFDVNIGQFFKKGDIIARVDPRDFENSVRRLEAALASAQANLKAMRRGARREDIGALVARRASVKASLTDAEAQYKRYQSLLKEKMVPQAEYDHVKTTYDVTVASLEQIDKELEKARNGSRSEDIEAMEKTIVTLDANLTDARNALEDTKLRAPFDGYIAQKFVENHESIETGQPIVEIMDCSVLEVTVGIPEDLVVRQNQFSRFVCEFDALPNECTEAFLKELGRKPEQLTQTYPLTVQFNAGEDCPVRPGMAAEVQISILKENTGASPFTVPVESVVSAKDGERFVWIVDSDSNRIQKRTVTVKQLLKDGLQVIGGFNAGDWIVTAGANFLVENQKVALLTGKE